MNYPPEIKVVVSEPDILGAKGTHAVFFDIMMRIYPDQDTREAIESWCEMLERQSSEFREKLSDPNWLKDTSWKDVAPSMSAAA